jgi:hypothetical protein
MQCNIEEKLESNLNQVIDNIQVELVMVIELVISITKPTIIATESFQLVQPVVEPLQLEDPQFFRF